MPVKCISLLSLPENVQGELFITKHVVLKPMKLLKLPFIVLEQVIKSMDVRETFIVSTCSKKTRALVKLSIKKRHYKCSVKIADAYIFEIYTESVEDDAFTYFYALDIYDQRGEADKRIKIGNREEVASYVWDDIDKYVTTYWQDIHSGATELYLDLMGLFNFTVVSVIVLEKWRVRMDYETAIDWIHENVQTKIGISRYFGKGVEDSVVSEILYGMSSNQCEFYLKPSENYRNNGFIFTDATPHWRIYEGHWLTIDNFFDMQCVTLIIDHSAFTDVELQILIINIINGSFPNLEYLSIMVKRTIDMEILLEGIDHKETESVRDFDRHGFNFSIPGGIDFQTMDRKTCTLNINRGEVETVMNVFSWK